ncbi:MAG: ABC transporter ATP-binding protein [Pseudorhodoplanes sp.]
MTALRAENVSVSLRGAPIVAQASLALAPGELVALVGPNGAGKTTLMRALAALLPADGTILLNGRPLRDVPARERARQIAYLPQGHDFHWPMPVDAIVALGRHPHADAFSTPGEADRAAVAQALRRTGTADLARRAVTTLSGGERARVALARALATQAPILLADEPTMSLDARHQLMVMQLLRDAARAGNAVLAVVHDLALAARFADRVAVMAQKRIVVDAPPAQALSAERIAEVFGVEAAIADVGDGPIPIPRRPL